MDTSLRELQPTRMRRAAAIAVTILASLLALTPADAASSPTNPPIASMAGPARLAQVDSLPAGFAETAVSGRLDAPPVSLALVPDGRVFVTTDDNDGTGAIYVVKNGNVLANPALELSVVSDGELGVIGMLLDPQFASNGYIYIMYTTNEGGKHNRLSRFTFSGDTINPSTETVVMDLDILGAGKVHNGGGMVFGRDGKLYVGVGDNQVGDNAQDSTNRLGSILRLNADGSIPTDNPFYGTLAGDNRAIFATGVRNPFTMDIDPDSGTIYYMDVGPARSEEINEVEAGANYGWPTYNGTANRPGFTDPVHSYNHNDGACAITGGQFNRSNNPEYPSNYVDKFFFMDFCGGWIRVMDIGGGSVSHFATTREDPVSLTIDDAGAMYYLSRGERKVFKIDLQAGGATLQITEAPEDAQIGLGEQATFTVSAAGSGSLTYQWQSQIPGASGFSDLPGETDNTLTVGPVTASDDGTQYRASVTDSAGTATSSAATLTVVGGRAPEPSITITVPDGERKYVAGQTLEFAGSATDPDEGALPNANLTWEVTFQHDDHNHPVTGVLSGVGGGEFEIPSVGETSANTWFRVHLTAVDSTGLETTIFEDVFPHKSTFTLATDPPGLEVTLDGAAEETPERVRGVVGIERQIGTSSPQVLDGEEYVFIRWSNDGMINQTISTPRTNATFTAIFESTSQATPTPVPTPTPTPTPATPTPVDERTHCDGQLVTVDLAQGDVPTNGDDVILGTEGTDLIAGGAGNDLICGLGGDDTIWGQAGDDRILGGTGEDIIRGGAGADSLFGEEGADDLAGGVGDDLVDGGLGDDTSVRGGTGDDIVRGGAGADKLVAGNGGFDTVSGGIGDDIKVTGGPRPDTVSGGVGNDTVKGNKGADILAGDDGDDMIFGGPQRDEIDGGAGIDTCNGGTTGNDAFENDTTVGCEIESNIP